MLFGLPKLIQSKTLNPNSPNRIKLPVNGGTFKKFIVYFFNTDNSVPTTAEMSAAVKSVTLEANRNGETFPIINAIDIDDINFLTVRAGSHNGVVVQDGRITYNPSDVNGVDEYHRRTLNLGTLDLQSMTIDIHTNALLDVARVEVYAVYDENDRQVLGSHRRIGYISPAISAGQTGKIDNILLPEFDYRFGYAAVHFKLPAGVVIKDFSQVRNTTQTDFLDVPNDVFAALDLDNRRAVQPGWLSLDYAREDVPSAFMPAGFATCQISPNVTTGPVGAVSMKVLYELIELDEGLRKQLVGR